MHGLRVVRFMIPLALIASLVLACDDGGETSGDPDLALVDTGTSPMPTGSDVVVIGSDVVDTADGAEAEVDLVDPVTLYAPLYDPDRVLDIDIWMSPTDWDLLRFQARDVLDVLGEGCLDGPPDAPYSWFRGEVTIDGEALSAVAVRKKGFLGSQSTVRPSLKLDFDRYVDDRRFHGLERMTLNNMRQDPTVLASCLGYGLFRDAGVPAPRCNFARVTVNGEYLGLFTHLQEVRENFLNEHFEEPDGPLLEGQLSDFRTGWTATFEHDGGDEALARARVDALREVLERPDESVLSAIDDIVDFDAFLTFWAMEVLIAHWDGYAGNTNNFFVYVDPSDGKIDFLPWGADALFQPPSSRGLPASVSAVAALPARLYADPNARARYQERLRELLETVWDADAILAEIDRMEAIVREHALPGQIEAMDERIAVTRAFVSSRAADVLAELDTGGATWDRPLRDSPCLVPRGQVDYTFEAVWDTLEADPFGLGSVTITTLEYDGMPLVTSTNGARAGSYVSEEAQTRAAVQLIAILDPQRAVFLGLDTPPDAMVTGAEVDLGFSGASGVLAIIELATGEADLLGYMIDGTVAFDLVEQTPGGAVRGRVWGPIYEL